MSSTKAESWQRIHVNIAGSRKQFISQLENIQQTQAQQLSRIVNHHKKTEFGRQHQFSEIKNTDDFVQAVPIQTYETLEPYFTAQAQDPASEVICFEETGGSTQGAKIIPYTENSLQSFQNALLPWLDDLLLSRPAIKQGSAYWSISPALRNKRTTSGGHPVGLDNDALYFGQKLAADIGNTLAVNADVAACVDFETWRYNTLSALIQAEDLRFISVWSPTFILDLVNHLPKILDQLLRELNKFNPKRAKQINAACQSHPIDTRQIWPDLDTISCWTDGASAGFLAKLKQLFPQAFIQGKGLLATEGIVSIPLSDAPAPVLTANSGFYEFLDENNTVRQSHELVQGKEYQVIITNDSGLYRYNLGDNVSMEGYYHNAPMLRFKGRCNHTSDICGEKLTDAFVADALSNVDGFAMLSPYQTTKSCYLLIVSDSNILADGIDSSLSKNPQYRYAREIGQLGPVEIRVIPDAMQHYTHHQMQKGQQLGDIKPPALNTDATTLDAILNT